MNHQPTKAHPDVLAQLDQGSIEGALMAAGSVALVFSELPATYRAIFQAIRTVPERALRRNALARIAFDNLLEFGAFDLAGEALLLMSSGSSQSNLTVALEQRIALLITKQVCADV